MGFTTFALWIGIAIAVVVFFKMSPSIPFTRRIFTAALIPVFLVLLFIFLSTIIALVLVIIFVVLLLSLLSSRRVKFRRY